MKSLIVLVSLLTVTLGSLSTGNVRAHIAPAANIPMRSGQYRTETTNADGSVAGQYGYLVEGQHVQVSYSTASQLAQDANNGQTYTSGTTSDVTTTTGLNTEGTPKIEESPKTEETPTTVETTDTTPVLTTVPLQTFNTPGAQTYGLSYPSAQLPTYYYHAKPVASGYYPTQQLPGYSYSAPFVPATGQSIGSHYYPNYINGYKYLYPQPTYAYNFGPVSGIGSSPIQPSQLTPQVYTSGQAGVVPIPAAPVYPAGGSGQAVQGSTYLTSVYPSGSSPAFTGQSGPTTYSGQVGVSQVFQKPIAVPATGQVYSGKPITSGPSQIAQTTQIGTSGAYTSPTFSYRSYYPAYPYGGYARRYSYGYPRFQYRINTY